ncbi:MAG: hypothetical protein IJO46_09610, partial [Thermoguttaceae bacterium]|nr:hypothetical protein [Thermoguttaceae bacterium]
MTFGSKSTSNVGAAGRSGPALPREFGFTAPLALDGAAQHGERRRQKPRRRLNRRGSRGNVSAPGLR